MQQEWPYTTPLSPFQVCPGPLGNPEDLAATPRADENLELLALVVEPDAVVVSQANYERVVADVAAIRALVPDLASIGYRPSHDGRSVALSSAEQGVEAWAMGAFRGFSADAASSLAQLMKTRAEGNVDIDRAILQRVFDNIE